MRLPLPRLLDLLFFLLAVLYILAGTALTPFHADEATQIHMSRDFAYQFLQGDYARLRYDPAAPLTSETQLRLINGTLNKYLIGLSVWLHGYSFDDLNTDWDWGGDWDYNVAAGHLPSGDVLLAARLPSALLGAAGVVAVFALGRWLGGRPVAYLATLFYATHPGLLINSRRAMMEGSLTFFSLLTVVAGIWFLTTLRAEHTPRTRWLSALALGISGGLTIASKHTGAATVAAVFAACGLWLLVRLALSAQGATLRERWRVSLVGIGQLVVAVLLVIGVFVLLNPGWWGGDPVEIARTILDWRQDLLAGQTQDHGGYRDAAAQMQGFVRTVYTATPEYYEVFFWAEYPAMTEQVARYQASPFAGIDIGASQVGAIALLLLSVGGIFALLRDPELRGEVRTVFGLWALAMIMVTFVSPVDWQRYYLPVYPVIGLLAAYAPFGIARWWRKIAAERQSKLAEKQISELAKAG
jgi:4-amino-4-deoxy-L-arabinose transferase-like glycosyltransferase